MKKAEVITVMGLSIALNIILARFLGINPAPFVRISMSFVAVAMGALLCGPLIGGLGAAAGDVLGFALFPVGGYIPGLTISAFLIGATYGVLLHHKKPSVYRALTASLVVCVVWEALLNSLWLSLALSQYAFWTIAMPRLLLTLVNVPLRTCVIYLMWRAMERIAPQYAAAVK